MADYIEPTQRSFNSAEATTADVISQASPGLVTKAGSVVRELIVRPMAYLAAWVNDNFLDKIASSSVMYLKTSQSTYNPIADMVASNYFVTRRQGTSAHGILTLTLTQSVMRLPRGSVFNVGGTTMLTPEQYIITNGDTSGTTSDFTYIKSVPYEGNWVANVPVVSASAGRLELPVGTTVTIGFSTNIILNAELTSPVTGGSDVETDAELMARAEYNTAESGIGSFYGLQKKFAKAPVAVLGMAVVAGEDKPLFRARYNNVNINPGGIVDCYVKTAKQPTTDAYQVTFTRATDKQGNPLDYYEGYVDQHCILRIESFILNGALFDDYNVVFEAPEESNMSVEAARLSMYQRTKITISTSAVSGAPGTGTAYCTYIPGIPALQDYIDSDAEHFIGQDTMVKAAVPVEVTFHCGYSAPSMLEDDQIELLKQTIEDYINNIQVGTRMINFSDLRKVCASAVPSADLRLPCVMTGKIYTRSGNVDTFHSNTGIFDISDPANTDYWDFRECYFSICADNIKVEAV